jgi:hypothetical protein
MKPRLALFCAVSAIVPGAVQAQTLSVTQLAAIRQSVSAPPTSFFGPQGQTLFLQAAITDVNGNYANAGVFALPAYTSGPASGGNYSIPMTPSPAFNGVYYWQGYAPTGYSNPWTLQFGDKGGLGAPVQTPAEVTGAPLPFASNITLSGDPSHPTFTWTHAQASRLNGSAFCIYNGELEVFCAFPGNGDITYTLPPASAGGYDLEPGNTYYLEISAYALRPGQTSLCNNTCIAAISDNFIVYVPPSDTLPLVHIPEPTSTNPNATTLRFAVSEGRRGRPASLRVCSSPGQVVSLVHKPRCPRPSHKLEHPCPPPRRLRANPISQRSVGAVQRNPSSARNAGRGCGMGERSASYWPADAGLASLTHPCPSYSLSNAAVESSFMFSHVYCHLPRPRAINPVPGATSVHAPQTGGGNK